MEYDKDGLWIGQCLSGEILNLSNMWFEEKEIIIRAKAKDSMGAESDWSTYKIVISKTKSNKI